MSNDTTIRIASFTLAGDGTAPIIGDALRSVTGVVDAALLIWTAQSAEMPGIFLDELDAIDASDLELLSVRHWPWQNNFAAARNAALTFAAETGADFGVMLDTDERVICHDPAALRAALSALPPHVTVALAHHHDGSHTRERFFRLPSRATFVGSTHEMVTLPPGEEKALLPRELIQWSELPKSPEQLRAKHTRDVAMLRADIAKDPSNGAAWFYLGESLHFLAHLPDGTVDIAMIDEAIRAYEEHNRLSRFEEARAWVAFKTGTAYLTKGLPHHAIECAARGLVYDPGMAELYWLAAVACINNGWVDQAEAWALSGMPHVQGTPSERRRVGFRYLQGVTTGIPEVLAAVRAARAPKCLGCRIVPRAPGHLFCIDCIPGHV